MRRRPVVMLAFVALAGCSSRTAEYPVDYTEEVALICESVCEKGATCMDPPYLEYDECITLCNGPGELLENSVCGEAFRAFYGCVADTETCEEYLDTHNTHLEDYTCREEGLAVAALLCGAEGND